MENIDIEQLDCEIPQAMSTPKMHDVNREIYSSENYRPSGCSQQPIFGKNELMNIEDQQLELGNLSDIEVVGNKFCNSSLQRTSTPEILRKHPDSNSSVELSPIIPRKKPKTSFDVSTILNTINENKLENDDTAKKQHETLNLDLEKIIDPGLQTPHPNDKELKALTPIKVIHEDIALNNTVSCCRRLFTSNLSAPLFTDTYNCDCPDCSYNLAQSAINPTTALMKCDNIRSQSSSDDVQDEAITSLFNDLASHCELLSKDFIPPGSSESLDLFSQTKDEAKLVSDSEIASSNANEGGKYSLWSSDNMERANPNSKSLNYQTQETNCRNIINKDAVNNNDGSAEHEIKRTGRLEDDINLSNSGADNSEVNVEDNIDVENNSIQLSTCTDEDNESNQQDDSDSSDKSTSLGESTSDDIDYSTTCTNTQSQYDRLTTDAENYPISASYGSKDNDNDKNKDAILDDSIEEICIRNSQQIENLHINEVDQIQSDVIDVTDIGDDEDTSPSSDVSSYNPEENGQCNSDEQLYCKVDISSITVDSNFDNSISEKIAVNGDDKSNNEIIYSNDAKVDQEKQSQLKAPDSDPTTNSEESIHLALSISSEEDKSWSRISGVSPLQSHIMQQKCHQHCQGDHTNGCSEKNDKLNNVEKPGRIMTSTPINSQSKVAEDLELSSLRSQETCSNSSYLCYPKQSKFMISTEVLDTLTVSQICDDISKDHNERFRKCYSQSTVLNKENIRPQHNTSLSAELEYKLLNNVDSLKHKIIPNDNDDILLPPNKKLKMLPNEEAILSYGLDGSSDLNTHSLEFNKTNKNTSCKVLPVFFGDEKMQNDDTIPYNVSEDGDKENRICSQILKNDQSSQSSDIPHRASSVDETLFRNIEGENIKKDLTY